MIRDTNSSAIINTDIAAFNKYKSDRLLARQNKSMQQMLENAMSRISSLETRLEELELNRNG